jgi:hypothetical protein
MACQSTSAARSEIDAQEKFILFFKVGIDARYERRDTASLERGAGAGNSRQRITVERTDAER